MTAPATRPKPKRSRWIALGAVVLIIVGGGIAYRHLTNPERIRALVEAQLQRYAGGLVTVGRAEFSLFQGTSLYDVVVKSPELGESTTLPPVFSCRQIKATHGPWGTIIGRPKIRSLIAVEPTCTLVYDQKERRSNLSRVLRKIISRKTSTFHAVPLIELRDARVHVIARDENHDRTVQDWELTIRGRTSLKDDATYDVVWQSTDRVDGERSGGHSQLDLRSGTIRNVEGGLPRMSTDTVMLAVNASMGGLGDWAELIGISGNVRVTDYDLGPPDTPETTRSATIDLTNATLSVPVDAEETALPRSQRYIRFSDVNGTATVSSDQIVADYVGTFHGSRCQVHGTVALPIDPERLYDFGFDMALSCAALELPRLDPKNHPDETRAVRVWPAIARVYDRYHPSGKADVEIELYRRAGQPGPPRIRSARITPRNASALVSVFPYRIDHLTGSIDITGSGGTLQAVKGLHDDARMTIDASFGKPGGYDPASVHVVGENVSLDDDLRAALSHSQRELWGQFAPVGTANLDVHVTRPANTPETPPTWITTTTATFDDLSARFQPFPYPLKHLRGSIQLSKGHVVINDIVSQNGQTRLHATGEVSFDAGRATDIQLRIDGQRVPFDDALLDSLPDSARLAIAAFHPTGVFNFSTTLTQNAGSKLHYDTVVTLLGATLTHDDLPITITEVHGELHITPEATILSNLTGRLRDADIQASGRIDHAGGGYSGTITALHLRPTAELVAALPPRWRDEFPITVEGDVDVEVQIRSKSRPHDGDQSSVTIAWNGASITLPQLPAPIEHVHGTLVVDAAGAHATGITGRYGQAELNADMTILFDGSKRRAEISGHVRGVPLDHSLLALLPAQLQPTWHRLSPGGTIDLAIDRLRYVNPGGSHTPTWHATGQARLRNVSLAGVAGLDRATGVVSFEGFISDRLGGTVLNGTMDLVGLRISERKLTPFTADWSLLRAADGTGRLLCDHMEAGLYGGSVSASLDIMLEPKGASYELSTRLKDVDLAPLLQPVQIARASENTTPHLQGRTDVQLNLSGILGDKMSRRGRASLEISRGKIYKVPVVFAMLQVLNLAMPNRDALDSIVASGFIDGDDVLVKNARISGKEMALVGQGTVAMPSLAADFYFVSINPNRWSRVPVLSDVIDRTSRELVGLSVSGTLHDPIVQPRAFRDVADELDRLFVRRKPKNRRNGER